MYPSDSFNEATERFASLAAPTLTLVADYAQYCDLFYEDTHLSSLFAEYNSSTNYTIRTRPLKQGHLNGTAVHAFNGDLSFFHSIEGILNPQQLRAEVLRNTRKLPKRSSPLPIKSLEEISLSHLHLDSPDQISLFEKQYLLNEILESARSYNPHISHAEIEYQDLIRRTCIASSDGFIISRQQPNIAVRLAVKLPHNGHLLEAQAKRTGYEQFGAISFSLAEELVHEVIAQIDHRKKAHPIPSGKMDIVFAGSAHPSMPKTGTHASIWLHETIGHLLEADQYDPTFFTEQSMIENLATLSISDDPLFGGSKQQGYDDEGSQGNKTALIHEGQLVGVLTDKYYASKRNEASSGNGRRQSFAHPPLPRMSTLYLHSGNASASSLIESVSNGIYVQSIESGFILPDTKELTLKVREGYLIENGRLTAPIADVVIKGNSSEFLRNLRGIGTDLPETPHRIRCKKKNQVLPVYVSSPTVLISQLRVHQSQMAE